MGLALLFCMSACGLLPSDDEEEDKRMSAVMLKARIISDWRERSESPGAGKNPAECVAIGKEEARCLRDEEPLERIDLFADEEDHPDRRIECAYFCRKEKLYWCHVKGGEEKIDLVYGPFPLQD